MGDAPEQSDRVLEYARPERGGAWFGYWSVGFGLVAWITVGILIALPSSPNRPSDLDYIPLKIVAFFSVLVGTPIGAILANLSLRRSANTAGVVGLVLNLAPWLIFLGVIVAGVVRRFI